MYACPGIGISARVDRYFSHARGNLMDSCSINTDEDRRGETPKNTTTENRNSIGSHLKALPSYRKTGTEEGVASSDCSSAAGPALEATRLGKGPATLEAPKKRKKRKNMGTGKATSVKRRELARQERLAREAAAAAPTADEDGSTTAEPSDTEGGSTSAAEIASQSPASALTAALAVREEVLLSQVRKRPLNEGGSSGSSEGSSTIMPPPKVPTSRRGRGGRGGAVVAARSATPSPIGTARGTEAHKRANEAAAERMMRVLADIPLNDTAAAEPAVGGDPPAANVATLQAENARLSGEVSGLQEKNKALHKELSAVQKANREIGRAHV